MRRNVPLYHEFPALITTILLNLRFKLLHASTPVSNVCNGGSVAFGNCGELQTAVPSAETGVYNLSLGCQDSSCCKQLFCLMDIKGGGWTVFQNRYDGTVDFNKPWTQYEEGFGSVFSEHWLGLKHIHELTNSGGPFDLLVKVHTAEDPDCLFYQHFTGFSVGDPTSLYQLTLSSFLDGNLQFTRPATMLTHEGGMGFSTFDNDNDLHSTPGFNCALHFYGGWWHRGCHHANVNGIYTPGCIGYSRGQGIDIYSAGDHDYSFAGSMLMFRPSSHPSADPTNLCTPSQRAVIEQCVAGTGHLGGSVRKCGPWGEWEGWEGCPDPPGCGIASTRIRRRVLRYDNYAPGTTLCRDGTDSEKVDTQAGFCPDDCSDTPIPAPDNICEGGATVYKDCAGIKTAIGITALTGVYLISAGCLTDSCCRPVYCLMDEDVFGGGWTAFQRRFNGTLNFHRNWTEYEEGFGEVQGEHWLGLKHVRSIVSVNGPYDLLLKVYEKNYPQCWRYQYYESFSIGSASEKYQLSAAWKTGNTNGAINWGCIYYLNANGNSEVGSKFSTYDQDNDKMAGSCTQLYYNGWWYGNCHTTSLNGFYYAGCTSGAKAMSSHRDSCFRLSYAGSMLLFRPKSFPSKALSNVCTQSDIPSCPVPDNSGWTVKKCGHWEEWGGWSSCEGPPTCRKTRTRQKILTLVPPGLTLCEDGSDPGEQHQQHEYCRELCDKVCHGMTKNPSYKIRHNILKIIGNMSDLDSCGDECLQLTTCVAFSINTVTQTCVLTDSTANLEPNTDRNIHLYSLN